jgi:hypothetical protein
VSCVSTILTMFTLYFLVLHNVLFEEGPKQHEESFYDLPLATFL